MNDPEFLNVENFIVHFVVLFRLLGIENLGFVIYVAIGVDIEILSFIRLLVSRVVVYNLAELVRNFKLYKVSNFWRVSNDKRSSVMFTFDYQIQTRRWSLHTVKSCVSRL